jgi:HKD family nuclease
MTVTEKQQQLDKCKQQLIDVLTKAHEMITVVEPVVSDSGLNIMMDDLSDMLEYFQQNESLRLKESLY